MGNLLDSFEGDTTLNITVAPRARLSEAVERRILDAITSGEIEVGAALPSEKELMEAFGVGRPAIREALAALRIKGFLDIRRGERPVVNPPSISPLVSMLDDIGRLLTLNEDGVGQLNELRKIVESSLAWEAAKSATDSEVAELQEINCQNAKNLDNPPEFLKGDLRFHQKLYDIAANPLLKILFKSFVTWEIPQRQTTAAKALKITHQQHLAIVAEIANHAPDRAYSMMNAHLFGK